MLKVNLIACVIGASLVTAPVMADAVKAEVKDYYKTVTEMVPYYKTECATVEVPIYGTTTQQGNAAGGALAGMIIGGILGKGATGDDKGAAVGAIMGGLVGADKGAKPKTGQVITGYRKQRQCQKVEHWRNEQRRTYDYSTISWMENGQRVTLEFFRPN